LPTRRRQFVLEVHAQLLNGSLEAAFCGWYPRFRPGVCRRPATHPTIPDALANADQRGPGSIRSANLPDP
jgi:hypothetical protein